MAGLALLALFGLTCASLLLVAASVTALMPVLGLPLALLAVAVAGLVLAGIAVLALRRMARRMVARRQAAASRLGLLRLGLALMPKRSLRRLELSAAGGVAVAVLLLRLLPRG